MTASAVPPEALPATGSAGLLRRFTAPRPTGAAWVLLWAVTVLGGVGALAPVLFRHVEVVPVDVVFRLIGFSFAVCGLLAWRRRPDSRVGLLMIGTGFAFYVSPLLGQLDSPVARTVALWLPDLWILPFVALLLTFLTGGRTRTVADRVVIGAIVVELLVLAPLWLVFSPGEDTLFGIVDAPGAAAVVDRVQKAVLVAVSLATTVIVGLRWRAAAAPGRRALLPALAGCGCLLLFAALLLVDLVGGGRIQWLLWVAACSIAAVPIAFLAGLLRSRLARGTLAGLFAGMRDMQPDALRDALARALGDPGLEISYGEALPVAAPGRSVTVVERGGTRLAVLVHDSSLDDDPELVEAVGAAAALARENRMLQAEVQRRLAATIAAGDAERRRIERNLHDGAQQRLVTLGLQLSLIRRRIRDDPADAELLVASASDELARSLAELRELARGVHPAILDRGLGVALESLVLRSAVPATLSIEPGPEPPQPVAFAAYYVASEALANTAKYAGAGAATVHVERRPGELLIEIADDGAGGADPLRGTGLRGLADRVEALGGALRVAERPGGGTVVGALLPLPSA
ncbi:hypothetical protein GCM10009836_07340 [Pseudonocardia ailaonensis]|uniref:histidine kinase n=1 Tax=Pseudonocardia ailaonensis TaxID=367279 RepID=A0ABN2MLT5_9PSEU